MAPNQSQLIIHKLVNCYPSMPSSTSSKALSGKPFAIRALTERAMEATLHGLVNTTLGYQRHEDDGSFPDVRHQLLEVKLQTSPTIDLGLVCPDSTIPLDIPPLAKQQVRHCDVRYAVFGGTTDGNTLVRLTQLFVTTGQDFFYSGKVCLRFFMNWPIGTGGALSEEGHGWPEPKPVHGRRWRRRIHTCGTRCPRCRKTMWSAYTNCRTVTTLEGLQRIRLHIRRCQNPSCSRYHLPYRPEEEGRIALPQHEFGLDVIALVGALRYQQHRSVPEIHQELVSRGVRICERSVTNLLDRYDELVSLRLSDSRRLRRSSGKQGRVILALDGLQPDVGHEVLWVLRDCLSGEVLLARSLLSSTESDLAGLITEVKQGACPYRLSGRSPMASTPSGTRWPGPCPRWLISCVIFITFGRRPGPSTRRIGTPRRNSRSGFAGFARSSVRWRPEGRRGRGDSGLLFRGTFSDHG